MKFLRFSLNDISHFGILENNLVKRIEGDIFSDNFKITDDSFNYDDLKILPPSNPSKIIGLGYNYKDLVGHKDSYDEPIIFLKPPSSIIGFGDTIVINEFKKTWVEVELAIVIGKKAKGISINEANKYIFGYTVANDVTSENILSRDHHLTRSKGWDTYCPVGPILVTDLKTNNLKLYNKINNTIFQDSNTKLRIFNDNKIVSFLSNIMTLYPGDIIITGTPANAEKSLIKDNDIVEVFVEGIGSLINNVKFT